MLYLAQVQNQTFSGKLGLRLLARQEDEETWTVMAEEVVVSVDAIALSQDSLVLVQRSSTGEIEPKNASNWVLDIVQTYLTSGVTPAFLQQETERAEQWRQSLTLQNQELARRSLELEARREQIQVIEAEWSRRSLELQAYQEQIQELEAELTRRSLELEACRNQIAALEASFQPDEEGDNHEN